MLAPTFGRSEQSYTNWSQATSRLTVIRCPPYVRQYFNPIQSQFDNIFPNFPPD
jgi:hypothetical protein